MLLLRLALGRSGNAALLLCGTPPSSPASLIALLLLLLLQGTNSN
jgi:hypothetical protein